MQTTTQLWPQQYLLNILASAVRAGYCYVHPISEEAARSLTARLNRLRRRKDKGAAYIIPPEYYRVTIVRWEPTHEDTEGNVWGQILLTYDRLPPAYNLPLISTPDIDPADERIPLAEAPLPLPDPIELEIPESIEDLIRRLTTDDG